MMFRLWAATEPRNGLFRTKPDADQAGKALCAAERAQGLRLCQNALSAFQGQCYGIFTTFL